MPRKKITASGLIFDSALQLLDDMFDYTIERHTEAVDAEQVYLVIQAKLAGMRRNLRGLLKKRWFKGSEREKCLARARELRQAELAMSYLVQTNRAAAALHNVFLANAGELPGMPELMGHFKIKIEAKRKK